MDSNKSDKPMAKENWAAATEKSISDDQRREAWKEGQAEAKEAKEGKEGGLLDGEDKPSLVFT